jgi:membrane protein DedA with SNARE-associated domain
MEIIILALCLQLLQIGTVVEGGADFYSGRLTKKERKGTFADELLADTSLKAYRYGHFSSVFCNYLPAGKNLQSFQAEELCELPGVFDPV